MVLKKRIIGLPQTTATTNSGSPIAWGTSSMLPTDTATTKLPKPATPASVTNPASLTPWTTVKSFSDNMTKPFGVDSTAPTSIKAPVDNTATPKTPQGNAIGQNADGSYIYEQSKPTTPATTPAPVAGTTTGTPATGITSPKPEFSWSLYDANNYLWSGKTKDQFTAMDVADQTNLINQAVQNVEERQAILDQVKVYAENKAKQEYQAKQNTISTNIQTGQNEIAQTQASQRIREAQTNLDNLKQNLGFLGTWGRPMKSATAIEWASRMLIQSEQTFNELKTIESEYKKMRDSGVEFNANAFEEQMRTLQKQLTDSVDASIIQAMQWFDSEAALASIDSPKKLFDLQQKYLDMVDTSVEGITNRQVNEMKNLQTRYADYAKQYAEDLKQRQTQQAEFTKNKNTLNENMSKAVGYYVDWNGSPLQTTDGKVIEYKDEADKPIIDWNTWKVAYFNTDANGNQVVEIKQLFTPEQKSPNIQKVWVWADWKDIYGYYDSATGQVKTLWANASTWSNTQVSDPTVQTSIAQYSQQQRGRATLQCGELVNDYIKKETWSKWSLGNSFADKVAWIEKIGRSDSPVVWWVFAFDIKTSQGNTWHTGIVTWVNPDWSITVLEANRKENSANWWVPSQWTYSPAQVSNMVFSQAPKNNNLSAVAKEAVKSWQINWTPTVQSGIIKELADAGEFDKWQGNSTFYTAKDTVKNEIASFAEWYAKRQQAKQIFNKLKADWTLWGATWWFDTLANKGKRFAGAWSTDVNNLNQILAESLSKYMNKISGATVSETEVERLREQIPNLSMWDKQFADAFEQYDLSMQRWLDNTLTKYWFNSYDDVKQKIYWDNKSEQTQATTTTWQISSDRQ